jgi:hypothetical protein
MSFNGDSPTLDDVRSVLERDGKHPVLLYIDKGLKWPLYTNWEKTTYEQTQAPSYQRFLERHSNTGVLLGVSDNLCAIDCDTESFLAEMILLNPSLASTLISAGERAGQFWIYVKGARPHKIEYLKVRKESPLALGAKKIENDGTVKMGEFRCEGGQSVIRGMHPCGNHYRWLSHGPPIVLDFAELNWPVDVIIPYRGYHEVHGGIYVSHGEKDRPIVLPDLQTAIDLIVDAVKDYDFVSPSDKSRAVASFISPALRVGKFLNDADFPIDIAEANESQGGKTYRLKLICAIYGEIPYIIANREGGVGSLDESISSALVAGIPFILFENFRGRMNSQLVETCLRGTGTAPARIPHRGEVQVSTTHINWQLSSNGLEATRDFVNRAIINRNSKQPAGYKFGRYTEGDLLAHIRANQPQYLGAVFRIIKEWFDRGAPRTEESRHDFSEWVQTLDWIVQNIFKLSPLVDGYVEEVLRVSDPALSWLRKIAIAVEKDNRLELGLSASDIVDVCQARGIDFPNKILSANLEQLAMYAGRLLGRLFRDVSFGETLSIDRYEVEHESRKQHRSSAFGGDFFKQFYWFRKR